MIRDPQPVLRVADSRKHVQPDDPKVELAGLIEEQLASQLGIVDWQHKDDVQREMRRLIKRQLRAAGYEHQKVESLAENVVDLMKRRRSS